MVSDKKYYVNEPTQQREIQYSASSRDAATTSLGSHGFCVIVIVAVVGRTK